MRRASPARRWRSLEGAVAALAAGEAGGAAGGDLEHLAAEAAPRGRGPRRAACRSPRSRRGGRRASSPAGSRRSSRPARAPARGARPGSTTSLTRPIRCASSASTGRPVRIISSARPMPTTRGSRWVPPSISGTPQRRSKRPKVEPRVAIRRSHQSASSTPPARHQPSIAAIAGFDGVRRVGPIGPSGWVTSRFIAFRSAPAQKASPPAPVRTRTRAPSSASKSRRPWRNSSAVGGVDRVAALGPVDRQHRGGADPLVAKLPAHRGRSSQSGSGRASRRRPSGPRRRRPAPGCAPARGAEGRCSAAGPKARDPVGHGPRPPKRARKSDR